MLNISNRDILPPEVIEKLNDPGVLITDEKTLKKSLDDFKIYVKNMRKPYASVYSYYAENTELISNPLQMAPIGYDTSRDALTYNAKFFKFTKYQQPTNITFSHELAH